MTEGRKPISFVGGSIDDLRSFPEDVRRSIGQQLAKVQAGETPEDWRPMKTVGKGVREIRVKSDTGAYRSIYIANLGSKIYVLHCFQKKTEQTSQKDIRLAIQRLKEAQND